MSNTKLKKATPSTTTASVTENDVSFQIEEQGQCQTKEEEEILRDLEYEIECPRCYDIMTLRSDFDNLYYSCEECGFILYTIKKGL
jgi:predicted RNA-binding Zn-ribbon protein involved in translation (DUF1610 family)